MIWDKMLVKSAPRMTGEMHGENLSVHAAQADGGGYSGAVEWRWARRLGLRVVAGQYSRCAKSVSIVQQGTSANVASRQHRAAFWNVQKSRIASQNEVGKVFATVAAGRRGNRASALRNGLSRAADDGRNFPCRDRCLLLVSFCGLFGPPNRPLGIGRHYRGSAERALNPWDNTAAIRRGHFVVPRRELGR